MDEYEDMIRTQRGEPPEKIYIRPERDRYFHTSYNEDMVEYVRKDLSLAPAKDAEMLAKLVDDLVEKAKKSGMLSEGPFSKWEIADRNLTKAKQALLAALSTPEWMDVIITMIDGMVNKYYAKEDGEHLYEIHTEIIIDLEGIKTALQEKAKP